jgi:AraC-like DNA-binding protein
VVESAGHLNPGDAEVAFDRFVLDPTLDDLVRHVWVARWDVPDGETRPQRVLTYPSANAVLQPSGARLHGPDRVLGVQVLTGRSWVVGVLLRPAATPLLTTTEPVRLAGHHEPLPGAPLARVVAAMDAPGPSRSGASGTVAQVLEDWLRPLAGRVEDAGRLANEAARVAEEDAGVLRVSELADALGVTVRTLSRVVRQHSGVTPKWLIECRRLQTAATTLYTDPRADLATLAADLGYTDQAHFTRRYRRVIGETPDRTRRRSPARA